VSRLVLRHLDFGRVEFTLRDGPGVEPRVVSVVVGSGRSWEQAVTFPNTVSEGGRATGDARLDRVIRDRAAEELVRLEAAMLAAGLRGAA
jgi:hypothetical protein